MYNPLYYPGLYSNNSEVVYVTVTEREKIVMDEYNKKQQELNKKEEDYKNQIKQLKNKVSKMNNLEMELESYKDNLNNIQNEASSSKKEIKRLESVLEDYICKIRFLAVDSLVLSEPNYHQIYLDIDDKEIKSYSITITQRYDCEYVPYGDDDDDDGYGLCPYDYRHEIGLKYKDFNIYDVFDIDDVYCDRKNGGCTGCSMHIINVKTTEKKIRVLKDILNKNFDVKIHY